MNSVFVVLVVDDYAAQRYASATVLRDEGFEVWEAGTGREALDKVKQGPDLVMLDIKLPDMSEKLSAQGAIPVGNTPEEFANFVKHEMSVWGKVAQQVGLKPD